MVGRRVSVAIDADVNPFVRGLTKAGLAAKGFASELDSADSRMSNLVQTGIALAPALVPLSAAVVPAIAGLATQLGAAATAAGVAVLAFQGVGDALKAVNTYHLLPTEQNLQKMQDALNSLGPAGADFVMFLDSLRPQLEGLQNVARAGLFPGMEDGIRAALTMLPQATSLVQSLATEMGNLTREAGMGLGGQAWTRFIDYIRTDAAPTLHAMGETLGNLATGFANLMVDFAPLSRSFTSGMMRMSAAFRDWTAGLAGSQGFEDFLSYVRESGPLAMRALESIGNALVAIVEAAAPVGHATLPVITVLADTLAHIAKSPVGPVLIGAAAGIAAVSRAVALYNAANGASMLRFLGSLRGIAAAAAVYGTVEALDALRHSTDQALPSVNQLTHSLLNLTDAQTAANLARELGSVGDALHRIDDPNMRLAALDKLHGMGSELSAVASGAELFAQHITDFGSGAALTLDNAKSSVQQLDRALSNIVANGGADRAKQAFRELATSQHLSAAEQKALMRLLPQYRDALTASANAADMDTAATSRNTAAQRQNLDAMRAVRSERLAAANAEIGYQQAIDDATAAAKKNGKTLDITTQKGRDNKTALLNLAAAWNQQSDATKASAGAHKAAIAEFVRAATQMGMNADKARAYAKRLLEIPPKRKTIIEADTSQAIGKILQLQAMHIPDKLFHVTAVYGTAGSTYNTRPSAGGGRFDSGGYTGPGGKYDPAGIVHRDEVVLPQEIVHRDARFLKQRYGFLPGMSDLPGYAGGGLVGGKGDPAVAKLVEEIRGLRHDLATKGKDALTGHDRRMKEIDLRQKEQDLREKHQQAREDRLNALRDKIGGLRGAIGGFHPETSLPGYEVRNPVLQAVSGDLADLRKSVHDAGGEWTKQLQHMAARMRTDALKIDQHERAIDAETKKRDDLNTKLDASSQALDSLAQTMSAFSDSVAGHFLPDLFSGSASSFGGGGGGGSSSDNSAAIRALMDQLQAVRADGTLDPLDRSYRASKLEAQIKTLGGDATDAAAGVSALSSSAADAGYSSASAAFSFDALKAQLNDATAQALAFADALKTLAAEGLNSDLFSSLASSGNVSAAVGLAALKPDQIAELNALQEANAAAAAQVASYATQQVYGAQQQALMAQNAKIEAAIKASDATMRHLNAQAKTLGRRVENGAEKGVASLGKQIDALRGAVADQGRQIRELSRAGKGRG